MRTRNVLVLGGVVVASLALGSSAAMADSARPAPARSVTISAVSGTAHLKTGEVIVVGPVPVKGSTKDSGCVVLTPVPGQPVEVRPAAGKTVLVPRGGKAVAALTAGETVVAPKGGTTVLVPAGAGTPVVVEAGPVDAVPCGVTGAKQK